MIFFGTQKCQKFPKAYKNGISAAGRRILFRVLIFDWYRRRLFLREAAPESEFWERMKLQASQNPQEKGWGVERRGKKRKKWDKSRIFWDHSQMSEVQSPPGYRISCARQGPPGSFPKSTRNLGFTASPPRSVSTSSCSITAPSLRDRWGHRDHLISRY